MTKIKKIFCLLVTIIAIYIIYDNFDNINNKFSKSFDQLMFNSPKIVEPEINLYHRAYNYEFISTSDDFIPTNFNDLLNIYYTVLNNGWDDFTFYCPTEYKECLNDLKKISNDEELLSNINNFVDPRNSYSTIKTLYDENGEITIKIKHLYEEKEINEINEEIKKLIDEKIKDDMSNEEKIKTIHDYIINITKYDLNAAKGLKTSYDSSRIQGVLYDHFAICSGYADTMAVFLNEMNFNNYKVSSATHVWNAVKIDDKWYHLDLTWDDPVGEKDDLTYDYYLIDTAKLDELNTNKTEHTFDKEIFRELK